jgi:hypothetical protein
LKIIKHGVRQLRPHHRGHGQRPGGGINLPLHTCARMVLMCARMVLTCAHMVLTCAHMVLTCTHMVLTCTHMVLMCARMAFMCARKVPEGFRKEPVIASVLFPAFIFFLFEVAANIRNRI